MLHQIGLFLMNGILLKREWMSPSESFTEDHVEKN